MDFFIDGRIKNIEKEKSEDSFFSSSYCSKNNLYTSIGLAPEKQQQINLDTFDELILFYNHNQSVFNKFETETGVDVWFFEHFRLYFTYRNFFLKLATMKLFLAKYPKGIIITNNKNLLNFLPKENLKFDYLELETNKANKKGLIKDFLFILKAYRFSRSKQKENLILSRVEDNVNGKDIRFGEIEELCDKMINREVLSLNKNKISNNYRKTLNTDQVMAKYLISINWLTDGFKFNKSYKTLVKNIKYLEGNDLVKSKFLFQLFKNNTKSYFVYYFRYKSFVKLFKKAKYKRVLFINENSPQQRGVQYAAKQQNVKVFAIQHGTIYSLHPAYIYGKYNKSPLLPDVTFLWGKYFEHLLIKVGGYLASQLKVTGPITPKTEKRINKEIDFSKKIIVYATQPQPDERLRKKELQDVFEAAKIFENEYTLIIRPHPAEKEDAIFLDLAKQVMCKNFIIDRFTDLKTHFEITDILITSYSTVGAEFIPYYKPLLVLDYLKADKVEYIAQGVGIPIHSGKELIEILNKDEIRIDKKAFDIFVENYFYKEGKEVQTIIKDYLESNL